MGVVDGVRRAGVSSFGVGGTNVHVVLEEAPTGRRREVRPGPQVLLMSAGAAEGLASCGLTWPPSCPAPDAPDLSDVAFTLGAGEPKGCGWRPSSTTRKHAVQVLEAAEHDNVFCRRVPRRAPSRTPEWSSSSRAKARNTPAWRAGCTNPSRCSPSTSTRAPTGFRRRARHRPARRGFRRTGAEPGSHRPRPAGPVRRGVCARRADSTITVCTPSALAGHSIGEYVAATLAGVFDLPTAITAVSARARLMHDAPPGVMVAVALGPDDIAEHLSPELDIAAINDPGNCVVSGPEDSKCGSS